LYVLGDLRVAQGRFGDAENIYRECIDVMLGSSGENFQTAAFETALGAAYLLDGKLQQARRWLDSAVLTLSHSASDNRVYMAAAKHWLGETLMAMGNLRAAKEMLTDALREWQITNLGDWYRARTENSLAELLIREGDRADGERLLRSSYARLLSQRGPNDEATRLARSRVDALDGSTRKSRHSN
jgi:tetratricopeptide (TPR) repeat protein